MSIVSKIQKLTSQLFPTGRAFRIFDSSYKKKLYNALSLSRAQAYADGLSTLDSALPDNDNFTADDATSWERRLGLITNVSVSLDDRKLAIIRKMNHPGTIPARENYRFLEKQLRDAGFDVYVYENRFDDGMGGWTQKTPGEVTGDVGLVVQYGDSQYGDSQYGTGFSDLIVNYLDESLDRVFNIGGNLRSTFFIGGAYLGDFADVPLIRKNEFRQIILRTKPVQTVGFLFINYV